MGAGRGRRGTVVRVLITGAGGQLGGELVEAFPGHEVLATTHADLDVTSRDATVGAINSWAPDAVVHAAAWTDVDGCESDVDRALSANVLGTRHVAEGARRAGATLCYISSDYVFAGDSGCPNTEWDETAPLSVYGRTKLAGEREAGEGALVVRSSWICGRRGHNFVKTMLRLAAASSDPLDVVDDQHGSPTFATDLAEMVALLVAARRRGVFHVTNQGATTWHGLARDVFALSGHDPDRVRPVATADLHPLRPAPRPAYSVLDNAALRLSGIPLLPHYAEPLERLIKELTA